MGILGKEFKQCPLDAAGFRNPCKKEYCEWWIHSDCAIRIIAENLMEIKREIKRNQSPVQEEFSRWSQQPEDSE